ncbi:DNA topoisomerase [Faecalibacterium prausnitzii]|uniref:DNA topoisomerase n=1 Tax=Faecalibacterium prausnitzii TaxID=853 RepID=A0A329TNP8_9FIRM|nr:DNA topoisomerase [Faecalibacterium prausnitzii]RAW51132.1 DNA topoisomerase III [Faecalibacterium prausnitzii]
MPSSNNVRKVTSENYPTDSGREGELIFRLVYQQAGCKKPFSRLWLSSMEENAIREGFARLKPSTEYDALYNAALCRERADWMVGINASRLFSCLYGQPLAVGRVMTSVLAMTVVREAAIAAFVPEKFYTVALTLADGGIASSKRFAQKADAELLLSKCRKEERFTVQKMERKEKSESPPPLYDLTALQRDANRLLGFTAQQTLDYAQSLYEKRLITYPRTDSRFLTEDMAASLPGLVTDTGRAFAVEESFPIHVQQVINGSKVTDHHALLPTKSMANADLAALPAGERNILRLIAARLLCAVGEPHRYAETTMTTICADEEFTAKGKVVLSDGWKGIERKMLGDLLGKKKEPAVLPDVQEQSECGIIGAELKEGQTSAPKHFTEDLLLHSMETASADSMPEDVERQGIGTPATRAATIEKLVQKGFLERKGDKKTKILLPTDKGKALITVMPEEIQSPEMTADWETKLLRIERGEMEPEEFMVEIKDMISSLVNTTEAMKGANVLMKNKIVGVCPNCGANVVEREKGWFCENRECRFALWKDNAYFKRLGKHLDGRMVDKLLRDGRVRLKDCRSAKGKTYNATVLLSCESDGRSKFSLEFENGGC